MEFFFLGGVHKVPLPHRDMKDRLFRLNGFFPELKGRGVGSKVESFRKHRILGKSRGEEGT